MEVVSFFLFKPDLPAQWEIRGRRFRRSREVWTPCSGRWVSFVVVSGMSNDVVRPSAGRPLAGHSRVTNAGG